MSTTTALDIINKALSGLQVLAPDVTLTAKEANDALDMLNMVVGLISNESLLLSHITGETFPLVIGQSAYTIGVGGNFNTSRPMDIEAATVTIGGSDWPVQLMAYDDWAAIRRKVIAAYPQFLYLDATYPLGIVNLYPVPLLASNITIYSRKPFSEFSSLTSSFSFPPAYDLMFVLMLQIYLAPSYQTSAGQDVKDQAKGVVASIKRTNKRLITAQVDPMLLTGNRGGFNIYRGN